MSPGFVAYVKMFPMKDGRSCSIVCMMMSYIFSWPLGEKHGSYLKQQKQMHSFFRMAICRVMYACYITELEFKKNLNW